MCVNDPEKHNVLKRRTLPKGGTLKTSTLGWTQLYYAKYVLLSHSRATYLIPCETYLIPCETLIPCGKGGIFKCRQPNRNYLEYGTAENVFHLLEPMNAICEHKTTRPRTTTRAMVTLFLLGYASEVKYFLWYAS